MYIFTAGTSSIRRCYFPSSISLYANFPVQAGNIRATLDQKSRDAVDAAADIGFGAAEGPKRSPEAKNRAELASFYSVQLEKASLGSGG